MERKEYTPYQAEILWKEIFETYYDIEAKAMYCYSQWELEVAGVTTLGDDNWDIAVANQYNITKRTVGDMADWLEDKIPFYLTRLTDAVYIYDKIVEYIQFIVGLLDDNRVSIARMRKSETLQNVVEDCDKLAHLANWLFKAVVAQKGEDAYRLFGLLNEEVKVENGRTAMRYLPGESASVVEGDELPVQVSITDTMSARLKEATRLWRKGDK